MDSLRPQIGACRTGVGPPELATSLFSQSVDSGRRQHLIEPKTGSRIGERGKMSIFPAFWCATTIQSFFSFARDKRSEHISDPQEVISGRSDYTHIQRALSGLQVQGTLNSYHKRRWPLRLMKDSPMRGYSRLVVHLLRLSEDSLNHRRRII